MICTTPAVSGTPARSGPPRTGSSGDPRGGRGQLAVLAGDHRRVGCGLHPADGSVAPRTSSRRGNCSACRPPSNGVPRKTHRRSAATGPVTTFAPRHRTLAALCARLIRAVPTSWIRAARMSGCGRRGRGRPGRRHQRPGAGRGCPGWRRPRAACRWRPRRHRQPPPGSSRLERGSGRWRPRDLGGMFPDRLLVGGR